MSEILPNGDEPAVLAHDGLAEPAASSSLESWFEKFQALDEDALQLLAPLLDAPDALDAMKIALKMIPCLLNPGRYLESKLADPCTEFMVSAFRLHQVAAFLRAPSRSPKHSGVLTLQAWCQQVLEVIAGEDEDTAAEISEWCFSVLARYDRGLSQWIRYIVSCAPTTNAHKPKPQQRRLHPMLEFIASAVRVLAEIPGVPSPHDKDWPLNSLDIEGVEQCFLALPVEERQNLVKEWGELQALVRKQRKLCLAANQLIRSLSHRLARSVPFDEATDAFLRECTVHRELTQLLDEMPAEDSRVLLSMARGLRGNQEQRAELLAQTTKES